MIDNRWGTSFLCLTRGISFERMDVSGDTIGFTASHYFQVVSRLQVQPERRRSLEVARKPQRSVRCNPSSLMENIRDPRKRHAEVESHPIHAEAERLHEFLAQDFTWMDWFQFLGHESLLVVIRDLDMAGIAFLPFKADSPLIVDSDAVLVFPISV